MKNPETLPPAPADGSACAERRILFFTCAAHCLTHVYMVIYSMVLDQMARSFELSREETTRYVSISLCLFGLGALPSSWLGEKFGEKRLLVAFFFVSAAGGLALGLAQGTTQLAASMALLGLGTSIYHPIGNAMIAKEIRLPGRAMGTNGLWGSLGEAIGPFFAGAAALLSWRIAYLALTVPSLLLGFLLLRTRLGHEEGESRTLTAARLPMGPGRGVLVPLLLAMLCGGFQFWLIKTMLPEHIEKHSLAGKEVGGLQVGLLTSGIYVLGGLGQFLAGRLAHRREGRGLYVLISFLSIPLIFAVGQLGGTSLLYAAGVMSVFIFASQPIENVLLARFAPPGWKGLLFGFKFTLAFGIGGLGGALSGWVETRHGTGGVFTAAAGFTGATLLLALAAYSMGRASRRGKGSAGLTGTGRGPLEASPRGFRP